MPTFYRCACWPRSMPAADNRLNPSALTTHQFNAFHHLPICWPGLQVLANSYITEVPAVSMTFKQKDAGLDSLQVCRGCRNGSCRGPAAGLQASRCNRWAA